MIAVARTNNESPDAAPSASVAPVPASSGLTYAPSYGQDTSGRYDFNGNSNLPGLATNYFATLGQAEAAWFAANPSYDTFQNGGAAPTPNDTAGGTIASNTPADALNPAIGVPSAPGGSATSATNTPVATDPFTQLATTLGNLASAGSGAVGLPSSNTAATAVPTQNAPSPILAILLIALAAGVVYFWYKHKHKHASHEG